MSNLLPIESLTREPRARQGFELAAPNPILGKTVFLRLPVSSEWSYEVDAADLRVARDLILRDQMWVTRGVARFVAVHTSGARCAVTVRIRPWNHGRRSEAPAETASARERDKPADERILSHSLLAPRSRRLILRCHHTEREIAIRWKGGTPADFERLVLSCECH